MDTLIEFAKENPALVQALSGFAIAVLTVLLIAITAWYALNTHRILRENRRLAEQTERLAEETKKMATVIVEEHEYNRPRIHSRWNGKSAFRNAGVTLTHKIQNPAEDNTMELIHWKGRYQFDSKPEWTITFEMPLNTPLTGQRSQDLALTAHFDFNEFQKKGLPFNPSTAGNDIVSRTRCVSKLRNG